MTHRFLVAAGLVALGCLGVWAGRLAWLRSLVVSPKGAPSMVGTAGCRSCHEPIADRYDTSGHAHTFSLAAESALARQLAGTEFVDPQRQQRFEYHLDAEGLSVSLPNVFGDERFPLMYALGSGTHAVTFLTLLPQNDGATVGLEHRVSYYRQLGGLGLTVGHPYLPSPVQDPEHFGNILDATKLADCIRCHTTQAKVQQPQLVDLIPHVGCESRHGPGSAHVAAQQSGLANQESSYADRWLTALAELQTCGACHRLPESLKASEIVRTSRVLPRFQPAGLMQSRCYTQSGGTLRCTTCHDPHATVTRDHGPYEQVCRSCHERQSVALCPQGTERCVQCHMPAIAFEGVASFHDHWIRVRTSEDPPAAAVEE